ncbi:MAG: hypothetical protein JXR07_12640 [Reichenbachiella sp.]
MKKLIFVFCLVFIGTQPTIGQVSTDSKISIELVNVNSIQALNQINELANIKLSYNPDDIRIEQNLNRKYSNDPVNSVLTDLLGNGFEYKYRGSYIIIKKKVELAEKKVFKFSGEIKDADTGETIQDVTVYEVSKLDATLSDKRGNFEMTVSSKTEYVTFAISQENYIDTLIQVKSISELQEPVKLKRKPDTTFTQKIGIETKKLVQFFTSKVSRNNAKNVSLEEVKPFQFSLVPMVGTNGSMSGQITNRFSINLLAGYSKGTTGLEVGGFYNIDRENVSMVQLAGFGNAVGGNTQGVQLAGFLNTNKGKTGGLQGAGFVNLVGGETQGAQLAGFVNYVADDFKGAQLAGFVNVAYESKAAQLAGFTNITTKNSSGTQLSGFTNVARNYKGAQISGFLNIGKNVSGFQGSAFLNISNNLKGAQLGLINIVDSLESGVTIGVINVVKNGLMEGAIETSDFMHALVSFRSGSNRLYSILSIGGQFKKRKLYSIGFGFGSKFKLYKKLYSNLELSSHGLEEDFTFNELNILNRFNLNIGYQFAKHLSITAGPVLNVYVTRMQNPETGEYGYDWGQSPMFETNDSGTNITGWLGFSAAIRF